VKRRGVENLAVNLKFTDRYEKLFQGYFKSILIESVILLPQKEKA
jgi:hypothetical protein